ncbi:hypothetical protein L6164_005048 [Bauhinia variegata]|uniref:Uncharacterized protein n=1 Tax=Bauhinia variegata TaxID=167791 RepID=A0ACB9PQ34_BAUVA|nr:hypothetical protein L6164_005048 [Bauhinia variegata]
MAVLTLFDDFALVKKIVAEHEPDQAIDYDVKSVLHIFEDILKTYSLSSEGVSTGDLEKNYHGKGKTQQSGYNNMLEVLSYEISRIFSELANIDATKQLPKSLEILKQLPGVMEQCAGSSKPRFDALNKLLEVILDVTKCAIEFNDLPRAYITPEVADYSSTASSHIPIAAYWSIRTIVFCATKVTFFTTLRDEVISGPWCQPQKLGSYSHCVTSSKTYSTISGNNWTVATDTLVSLDVLRRKNVLLLISGLDFSHNELSILEKIYDDSRKKELGTQYEIVWLPIVEQQNNEWNGSMQRQFERLQSTMPWYSVYHPSLIAKPVNWFVQKEWKYKNKPILVVLDPYQGRVVCPNAIHMMCIWGSYAFPFTSAREEDLWREETRRLGLLVDGIDAEILNWIKGEKYIMLYGSGDVDWTRKFVKEARRLGWLHGYPCRWFILEKEITGSKFSECWTP